MTPFLAEATELSPADRTRGTASARSSAACLAGFALVATVALACAVRSASAGEDPAGKALLDQMTKGKMETDLGRYDSAIAAFTAVAESKEATSALRIEALVRLGVVRREAGDAEGAFAVFERAAKDPRLDRQTKALLVRALGGVVPGDERWETIWPQVAFTADRSDPKRPTLAILWPGVPRAKRVPEGTAISLDFQNGDLHDIFRLFADISGLNVVVFPGVNGYANLKVHDEPWPDVLARILAANGLAFQWEDNVLLIAEPERLGPPRHFSGRRIDVEWGPDADPSHPGLGQDLKEALDEIAAAGQARVVLVPGVQGRVVFKLIQVRWDQAFDVLARVNGLEWTRKGNDLEVFPRRDASPQARPVRP